MTSEMLIAEDYLRVVNDRGNRNLPLSRIYHNMRKRGLFLKAYAKIYRNAGATTIGTDPNDTIQGMSLKRIDDIIQQLHDGTYSWKPSRRINIPKSNGRTRPISIPTWSDKLVQEVMRMILEAYFEPQFRESSHGFRPNHSCHTALRDIKTKWNATKWFIEGDIKGCFENINHELVIELLSRHIHDNRFLKLVKGALEAGYLEDWKYEETFSGTPQGGVISPILSNIVLHELDRFVEDGLIPKYTRGKTRRENREYRTVRARIERAKAKGQIEAVKQHREHYRQIPSMNEFDPNFRRLRYCRYADDFLLGVIGTKEEAQEIKQELKSFLQSIKLTLSEEKTHITHARSECASFLGYDITTSWNNTKITKYHDGSGQRRSVNGVIQLFVPRRVRTEWIRRYTRNKKPAHIGRYMELSDYEIVLTYGAQLRGLVNYYSLATNCGTAISNIRWYCMESCRKTLGAKHKIRSTKALYAKYYKKAQTENGWKHIRVTIAWENKPPLVARCGETRIVTRKLPFSPKDEIPAFMIAGGKSELVTTLLAGKCQLCGCEDQLEAHHIRQLKDLKRTWQGKTAPPNWVKSMIARRRKTIVVCRDCHQDITLGRHDGVKLK